MRRKPRGQGTVSARIPADVQDELLAMARVEGRTISQMLARLVDEGIRMRRFPGIVFAYGPAGRRAHLAGTGLDVWEAVGLYRAYGQDASRLVGDHPILVPPALELSLAYARAYPDEIEQALADNARQAQTYAPA